MDDECKHDSGEQLSLADKGYPEWCSDCGAIYRAMDGVGWKLPREKTLRLQ